MKKLLGKFKGKGMHLFAAVNILSLLIGTVLCFSAMNQAVNYFSIQKDFTLEEYLAFHKVFPDRPILYSLEAFTVNLADDDEEKMAQVEVSLEIMDELGYEELITKKAFVRDTVVKVLSQKNSDELGSIQGKLFLKDDIALAVNQDLTKAFVKGVYFTRFLIQAQ